VLKDIDIEFCNAGGVLFGVKDYVPALMNTSTSTMRTELHAQSGQHRRPGEKAWFTDRRRAGNKETVEKSST
jgi:sulfide:quinone oxidoreductase